MKDIVGLRVGRLTVSNETKSVKKNKLFKCVCDCGQERYYTKQNLLKGNLRSCGCFKAESRGQVNQNWKGVGNISASLYGRIKWIADRREIPFKVSIEYLAKLFEKQNGKCALSGLEITTPITWKDGRRRKDYNASLDRIDSSKPYIENNVQWVTKEINMMKQQFNQERFLDLCSTISQYNKKS